MFSRSSRLVAAILLTVCALWGQTTTGQITGTTTDTSKSVIPGVTLTSIHLGTGASQTTTSN